MLDGILPLQSILTASSNTKSRRSTKDHNIDSVSFLTVQVGALTGVEPPYLQMYYGDLTKDTVMEGSELKIEVVEPSAFCRCCGEVFNPDEEERICPGCGMSDYEILHGKELSIKELGFR